MAFVDVLFSTTELIEVPQAIVVVIDVLRATSTIVTALGNGARAVVPVASVSEAQKTAARQSDVLLAGERQALKPEHFDLGNSPLEYLSAHITGKTIVLTTSNGTRAIKSVGAAQQIVVGSFLNAGAVTHYLNQAKRDVLLYCAGTEGRFALEDALCAAYFLNELRHFTLSNAALWTLQGARAFFPVASVNKSDHILKAISRSEHARRLKKLGFEKDIAYCAQLNTYSFIPVLQEGKFIK